MCNFCPNLFCKETISCLHCRQTMCEQGFEEHLESCDHCLDIHGFIAEFLIPAVIISNELLARANACVSCGRDLTGQKAMGVLKGRMCFECIANGGKVGAA